MNPDYKTLMGALRGLVNAVRKNTHQTPILLRRKKNPMVFQMVDLQDYLTLAGTTDFKPWEIAVNLTPQDVVRLGAVLQIDLFKENPDASPA